MTTGNGKQETEPMWRECIPPQTPPPPKVVDGEEPKTTKHRLFSDLFAWWRNARERKLRNRIAILEAKLARAELERDQLAEANEMMRQWVLASTATAARVIESLGGRPPEPPKPPLKRTGAYG